MSGWKWFKMDPKKAHYVAVTVIVMDDKGRFLITKRSDNEKAFPGLWTVPGGKLEMDDYIRTPKDTPNQWYNIIEKVARREVKEEAGVDIKNINYLTSLTFIRPDNVPVVVLSLYADHHAGKVKLNEESVDYAWVSLEQAKSYKMIDGIYDELVMLDRKLKGEQVSEWERQIKE